MGFENGDSPPVPIEMAVTKTQEFSEEVQIRV